MENKPGNFVSAALPSIATHCKNTIADHSDYLADEQVASFFHSNINKFLTSIGVVISKLSNDPVLRKKQISSNRMSTDLVKKYVNILEQFNSYRFLKGTERIIDSGAFSLQVGYFDRVEIPQFIDLYHHEFLANQSHNFDYAFLFDVAPGAKECPFYSFRDMYDLANESYRIAGTLNENVRNKLIYVHHFRTPNINKIYKKLLQDHAHNFQHFSTGGLVSFSKTGDSPPVIMYVIPLIHIIQHAKQRNLKKFRFHVLGGSEWKDIIGHKFFQRHIKELFDIDVEITFDSSTLFKTMCLGRYTFMPDFESKGIRKLSLRSEKQHLYDEGRRSSKKNLKTNAETFCELVNEAITPHGMKPLNLDEIDLYDGYIPPVDGIINEHTSPSGSMNRLTYTYGMFQLLRLFKIVEDWCDEFVDELYPLYVSGNEEDKIKINNRLENIMMQLNGGEVLSATVAAKSTTIINSLELLNSLKKNPDNVLNVCDELIDIYMAKSECEQLQPRTKKESPVLFEMNVKTEKFNVK